MNSRQLECFVQVAEVLNFSVAAKNLYITQPTVSHQIQSLEAELGVKLFIRNRKNVDLTAAGEIFYSDAKELLTRERIALSRVKNTTVHFDTKIAIGFSANHRECQVLPEFIKQYNDNHSEIYLYFRKFIPKVGIQNLAENKMDILLYNTREIAEYKDLQTKELFSDYFECLVSVQSALANKKSLNIADLKDEYFIFPEASISTIETKNLIARIQTLIPNAPIYYCDDIEVSTMLVKSGLGVALIPSLERIISPHTVSIPICIEDELNQIPYGIAWHKKNSSKEIKVFIKQLMDYLPEKLK